MNTKNTRKGFTTVELVIVIAVIAILATVLIPTFSNMIEAANLSVDKQNVRNMNICLATYSITDGDPSDAALVKARLREYGYDGEGNFAAKAKGHSYWWYTDNRGTDDKTDDISVILLLNAAGEVVFPEEYVNDPTIKVNDPTMCFNLSAPLAFVNPQEPGKEYFESLTEINMLISEMVKPLMQQYATLSGDEKQGFEDAFKDVFGGDQTASLAERQAARRPSVQKAKKPGGSETYNSAYDQYAKYFEDEIKEAKPLGNDVKVGELFANQFKALADDFDGTFGVYASDPNEAIKNVRKAFSYALAVRYEFAATEDSELYANWKTTYYVSVKLPDELKNQDVNKVSLALAGYHAAYGKWEIVTVTLEEGPSVDLLAVLFESYGYGDDYNDGVTYSEVKESFSPFTCGVVDLACLSKAEKLALFKKEIGGNGELPVMPSGVELTVELRMTNPGNAEETRTIGVYTYTFSTEIAQIG